MLRAYKTAYELSRSLVEKPYVGFNETFQMYKTTQNLQSTFFDDCRRPRECRDSQQFPLSKGEREASGSQQFPLSRGWRACPAHAGEASGDVASNENRINPPVSPFRKGGLADIAILDYRPQTSISIDNLWGHMLYGAAENSVYGTIAAGEVLYWNHELKYLDEEKLTHECCSASEKLWKRL